MIEKRGGIFALVRRMWHRKKGNFFKRKKHNDFSGMTEKVTNIRIVEGVTNKTRTLKIDSYKRRKIYFSEVLTNAVL